MTTWWTNFRLRSCGIVLVLLLSLSRSASAVDFEREVAPILIRRCVECHAGAEAAGKFELTTADGIGKGGESGAAVVVGKPDESFLWQRVRDGEMPPKKQGKSQALSANEVEVLRAWIADGAAWPAGRKLELFEATTGKRAGRDWWSLQPIQHPPVPVLKQTERVANPVDAFV